MLLLWVLVVLEETLNQVMVEMANLVETLIFILLTIPHTLPLNIFVELEEVEHQVGLEEMVLLLLADQVEVEVEKTLMEQQIILLEQQ
tara:strand:- start:162 stop:425 length:264 start_codon:yes stop_codon:yes gene_type:complete